MAESKQNLFGRRHGNKMEGLPVGCHNELDTHIIVTMPHRGPKLYFVKKTYNSVESHVVYGYLDVSEYLGDM